MDTKPELIRLEAVDPAVLTANNMYIKNDLVYHVETPAHHVVKKEDHHKLYYDGNHHQHLQETKHYIPDTVHNFQTAKPMSQYPKYQTPKLRAKSTYSPMKTMVPQTTPPTHHHHTMYNIKQHNQSATGTADAAIMLAEQQHLQQNAAGHQQQHQTTHDHNTVQVITPNANFTAQQQWSTPGGADVTMTPIMDQQTMHTDGGAVASGGTSVTHATVAGTPDAIFIPETSANVLTTTDNSADYNATMNAPTINLIPLMTPNGLVFVAANNSSSGTVISGVPTNNTVETHHVSPSTTSTQTIQQHIAAPAPTPTPARSYNRRKQPAKRIAQQPQPTQVNLQELQQQSNPSAGGGNSGSGSIATAAGSGGTAATATAINASNHLIYTQNGPLLLLNENRAQTQQPQHHHHQQHQTVDYKPVINTPVAPLIPEKGTVIEEPPKAIYQSRYSDINENSTRYNTKNGVKSGASSSITQADAELDLDAAITVFKIYK